jgi:hypothetical protein
MTRHRNRLLATLSLTVLLGVPVQAMAQWPGNLSTGTIKAVYPDYGCFYFDCDVTSGWWVFPTPTATIEINNQVYPLNRSTLQGLNSILGRGIRATVHVGAIDTRGRRDQWSMLVDGGKVH